MDVLDNYANRIPFFGAYQQNLAVIVSKICTLNSLGDDACRLSVWLPQRHLVGSLDVDLGLDKFLVNL